MALPFLIRLPPHADAARNGFCPSRGRVASPTRIPTRLPVCPVSSFGWTRWGGIGGHIGFRAGGSRLKRGSRTSRFNFRNTGFDVDAGDGRISLIGSGLFGFGAAVTAAPEGTVPVGPASQAFMSFLLSA